MADEDDDIDQKEDLEADAETEVDIEAEDDEEIGDDLDVAVEDSDVEVVAEADTELEEDEAEVVEAGAGRRVAARSRPKREENEALHTVAAREDLRRKLAADVEAFLERGGAIQDVPQDVRADPPKKPENNYGRGSL